MSPEHFNQLTPSQDELLAVLAEECAEVVVAITKIQRHGLESRDPTTSNSPTNREALTRELGDVLAAISLVVEGEIVDGDRVALAAEEKEKGIAQWLHHYEAKP